MHATDICSALHHKHLRGQACPKTLIIHELGLVHGRSRIDIAVINRHIHGYEIKSAYDSLVRLQTQLHIYRQTLQKLTIVTAPKHLLSIRRQVPTWCGLIQAQRSMQGDVQFIPIRPALMNTEVVPVMQAHLLWRSEVIKLLTERGFPSKELRHPRVRLYQMLCEILPLRELTTAIHRCMLHREAWRDHGQIG